ncbi:MAG: hypothetical protein C0601_01010 [Candidatus Muiribacterium halophilum]|uniref:Anti-sigma factor antagonist n=1 Tax=Muiribacterium halophilum TaxID=2053465 RepID=A0A2N5ZME2_MUIH1|nr:MAG: hypothetical protein C0601_01010 [Candidatus Muirbacterium halophilum]
MLKIERTENPEYILVTLKGEADFNSELELRREFEDLITKKVDIVIDLEHTDYIDSVGISLFTYLKKELIKKNREMAFYRPIDSIKKVFLMTRLDLLIPILEKVEDLEKFGKEK